MILAASVSKTTADVVRNALEIVPIKKVQEWFKENVGRSVQPIEAELNFIVKKPKQKREQKIVEAFG